MAIQMLKEKWDMDAQVKLEVFRRQKDNVLCYRIRDLDTDQNISFVQFMIEKDEQEAIEQALGDFFIITETSNPTPEQISYEGCCGWGFKTFEGVIQYYGKRTPSSTILRVIRSESGRTRKELMTSEEVLENYDAFRNDLAERHEHSDTMKPLTDWELSLLEA